MSCENDKTLILAWLNQELTEAERVTLEAHLSVCTECRQELEATQQVWKLMGEMPAPEPSPAMRVQFQSMLEEFKESEQQKISHGAGFFDRIKKLWSGEPVMQFAYSLVLLIVGLGLGWLITNGGADRKEIASLSSQVHEMKEMMMLSLLENPSASERIRGVSYTSEIKTANKEVIDALFSTLNNDQNVNVRLVTLEALMQYAGQPEVREGLVQSIVQQESPLMQSALADAMVKLQEKKSVQSFRKLLQQKDLDKSVRNKIEQTITGLI